jgi:hypothetical protein
MKGFAEIETRKQEIRSLLQSDEQVDLEALQQELKALNDEKESIEKRSRLAAEIGTGSVAVAEIQKPEERGVQSMIEIPVVETAEYRVAFLKNLQGKQLSEIEKRTLTTTSGATGAVPTTTLNLIIDKLRQVSVLFPRVSVSFVPGNLSFVVANAKNAAAWHVQGAAGTAYDDTVASVSLSGYELIKLVEVSIAAQQMTIDAFESYIVAEIGRQLAIALENAILNGSGSAQPTGILNGVTWDSSNSTTWAINSTLSYDNIVDGLALLPTMYHPQAVFVMSRKTLFSGLRKIKTTYGEPLFTYAPTDKAAMSILGYPVIVDDYIADDTILFGDLSYYKLNFSLAPTIETSREAAFSYGKITYRGLAVVDGKPALSEAFVKISKALA